MRVSLGGIRTGSAELLEQQDPVTIEQAQNLGGSFKAGTLSNGKKVSAYREEARIRDERLMNTVPAIYRELKIDTDGVMISVDSIESVEKVLEALDPDQVQRYANEPIDPYLVGLLALPIQFALEANDKRAQVEVIKAEDVAKLNVELGREIALMQEQKKAPKIYKEYLPRLHDAWKRSRGNGSAKPTQGTSGKDLNAVATGGVDNTASAGVRNASGTTKRIIAQNNARRVPVFWSGMDARTLKSLCSIRM